MNKLQAILRFPIPYSLVSAYIFLLHQPHAQFLISTHITRFSHTCFGTHIVNHLQGEKYATFLKPNAMSLGSFFLHQLRRKPRYNAKGTTAHILKAWCLLTYLLTYLLTPCSSVLVKNLTGSQLVKKFPAFYGPRMFITAVTNARHLSLSLVRSIQSILPHPTS